LRLGTSGSPGERAVVVTARPRRVPALICSIARRPSASWRNGCRTTLASLLRTGLARVAMSPRGGRPGDRRWRHARPWRRRQRGQRDALRKAKLHFITDLAPIAGLVRFPNSMTVQASFPAKTVPEFIAYAKESPGKLNQGSSGRGTTQHLAGEFVPDHGRGKLRPCPYRVPHQPSPLC